MLTMLPRFFYARVALRSLLTRKRVLSLPGIVSNYRRRNMDTKHMSPKVQFDSTPLTAGAEPAFGVMRHRPRWNVRGAELAVLVAIAMGGGCENAQQGAVSGAGIGALSGLAIGSMSGNAGQGAAIGAIVGGVGGATVGDQNRRRNEEAARQASRSSQTIVVQQPPVSTVVTVRSAPPVQSVIVQGAYQTGSALGRLVGQWNATGTIDAGNGTTLPVRGTARATVDMTYFVRLDVHFTDPRSGSLVDGTMVISQTGQRGVELTSSFSSSPDVRRYTGEMDASGTVLNFSQVSPAHSSRRVVMRLSPGIEWTAEVWDRGSRIEAYTFTWVGP